MLIGAMNDPARDLKGEIDWMAGLRLDFIDLTLEPPRAAAWQIDAAAIRSALESAGLRVVGHTAYYLPIASPFEEIRRAAVREIARCIELFARLGATCVNIHPDSHTPMHDRSFFISRNLESLRELAGPARDFGITLMIENLPGEFNSAPQLGDLLGALPELGLHLDIGHANLMVPRNTTEEILHAWSGRLRHVHLHDNKGGHADLHLPLGAGNVDFRRAVQILKTHGYDDTITLEVFSPDRTYLAYSRDVLRRAWTEAPPA